ncbi:hypothetical protein [Tsukamurella ocularis]|uniref:hypothetical protein n=1 Tax=Tsukamurella ocularis TaxID=1970234 RepID=UPI00216A1075|nr:hypothetical protein [Tsukamurella ocularis]MCS3782355.1 hypothetical protein [Tsukamurella ocularis]MCS3789759.1 hypothetical protein [Tsukamurella ocularis]MCS3853145.1 hypothetical protein [Tsukamurella ocularis]
MMDSDQLGRDRGLNAVNGRAFADPDEERAARALMGAPFPATTEGLIEAGWGLVPILQTRSGTALATAAEARLAAILGLLDLRRLGPGAAHAQAELERHRRAAHRAQIPVEVAAAVAIALVVAGAGAVVLWLLSLLGAVFAIGALIAVVILASCVVGILRWMERAELDPARFTVRGLVIAPWLAGLPAATAAAVQSLFDLPHGLAGVTFTEDRDLVTVDDGAGTVGVVSRSRFLWDAQRTAPLTADDVRDLLTGYLRPGVPGALALRGEVPAPAWLRGPFDGWERLFDRFGVVGPITVRWTVQGGALIAELAEEYDDEPAAVLVGDLAAIAAMSGAAAHRSADDAGRAVADLLVNQLVHGDLVMFTRGGGPADRELLVTALQGGDLRDAAVRSQWTGEH